jgi:hypothetical protein
MTETAYTRRLRTKPGSAEGVAANQPSVERRQRTRTSRNPVTLSQSFATFDQVAVEIRGACRFERLGRVKVQLHVERALALHIQLQPRSFRNRQPSALG